MNRAMEYLTAFVLRHLAAFLCFFASSAYLFLTTGYTHIIYSLWQVLPREVLLEHPIQSLWYCHAQPPILNALILMLETLGRLPFVTADFFATVFSLSCSLWILVSYHWITLELTASRAAAAFVPVLLILNPFYYDMIGFIFYTPIVVALLSALVIVILKMPHPWPLNSMIGIALILTVLVYTRSLWHPLFAVFVFGLLAYKQVPRAIKPLGIPLLLFLALSIPWMLKNEAQFGHFGFTSWTGFNLGGEKTKSFIETHDYDQEIVANYYTDAELSRYSKIPVLSRMEKDIDFPPELKGLTTNVNHYAVPALSAYDMEQRTTLFRNNPSIFLKRSARHLAHYDLPTWENPYALDEKTGSVREEVQESYSLYQQVHALLYHGSWLERFIVIPLGEVPFRPSHYFALLLPFALITALFAASQDPGSHRRYALLVMVFSILWLIGISALVDGLESNRMRRQTEPLYLVLLLHGIVWIKRRCHSGDVLKSKLGDPDEENAS